MRRLVVSLVLLAGCASTSEYVPGPSITVREPTFSGQITPPAGGRGERQVYPAQDLSQPPLPAAMEPQDGSWSRRWLRGGPGFTWGSASRLPFRDEGLDRRMVDMLSGGSANTPLQSDLYVLTRLPQEEPRTADQREAPKLAASSSFADGRESWTFPPASSKGEVPRSRRPEPLHSASRKYSRESDIADTSRATRDGRSSERYAPARRPARPNDEGRLSRREWSPATREESDLP